MPNPHGTNAPMKAPRACWLFWASSSGGASETKIAVRRDHLATPWPQLAQEEIRAHRHWQGFVNCGAGLMPLYQKLPRASDMRVLLIEDDSATAQSIELMLKSESFNLYTTDLGEEGVDLGKIYDYDIILHRPQSLYVAINRFHSNGMEYFPPQWRSFCSHELRRIKTHV